MTGRLTDPGKAPGGRLALSGYHDIADLDPFSPGRSVANTVNGLFAGHDNGDYALAGGGSASFNMPIRAGLELILSAESRTAEQRPRGREVGGQRFPGRNRSLPSEPAGR